jgi:hypothetical protein
MPTTQQTAPCDHQGRVIFDAGTGACQCGVCGNVWVSREVVQARNHKVARSVMQSLGTLIGGTKPPKPPGG